MPRLAILVPLALAVLVQGWGCDLVLRAGRLEARGDLAAARSLVRRGGLLAAGASVAGTFAALGLALVLGPLSDAPASLSEPHFAVALAVGVFGIPLSGFAALLAGLSRKPRPTGWAATTLLVLAALALGCLPWFAFL